MNMRLVCLLLIIVIAGCFFPTNVILLGPFYNSVGPFTTQLRGLFTTLCGYAGKGQQGAIERINPPSTNSKYRLKSFCEIGYANFRPNVFAAGKKISMDILVGEGLHARCPIALKRFVAFSKNGNVQEKYVSFL